MTEQATLDFENPRDLYPYMGELPKGLRYLADRIRHAGYGKPISGERLARIHGMSTRAIAASVEELVIKHRLPIGSVRGAPAGYFWIRTHAELEAACAMLHATAMKLLIREKALKQITNDELLQQIRLSLTGEGSATPGGTGPGDDA